MIILTAAPAGAIIDRPLLRFPPCVGWAHIRPPCVKGAVSEADWGIDNFDYRSVWLAAAIIVLYAGADTRIDPFYANRPYALYRRLSFYCPYSGYPNRRRRREGAEALPYTGLAVIRTRSQKSTHP